MIFFSQYSGYMQWQGLKNLLDWWIFSNRIILSTVRYEKSSRQGASMLHRLRRFARILTLSTHHVDSSPAVKEKNVYLCFRSGAIRIRTRHNRWDNFINCPCGSKVTLQAAPGTRVERLVARIEQWIEQGLLKPGERLRSVRAGAAEWIESLGTLFS